MDLWLIGSFTALFAFFYSLVSPPSSFRLLGKRDRDYFLGRYIFPLYLYTRLPLLQFYLASP